MKYTLSLATVIVSTIQALPHHRRTQPALSDSIDCETDGYHCINSTAVDLGGGSFVVPLFYADSTADPNGLECDSVVITKDGKQIGLTGSCGATAFETPQFEVACVGVTIYNGKYILKEEDLGVTPDVAKVSFDVKDSQGQLYSYWTGERSASIIQFQELKNIDFKSSLMSKHRPYEAVNGGMSYVPGIDMTVHCPDPKVNPSRDS